MAKYTAEITNKDIIDGELILQLRYIGDDGTIIQDSARTRDTQDENWVTNLIAKKIASLEELPTFVDTIQLGEVNIVKDNLLIERIKLPREQYLEDLDQFSRLFMLVRYGIIDEDNNKVIELRHKLRDNLNLDYLNIL